MKTVRAMRAVFVTPRRWMPSEREAVVHRRHACVVALAQVLVHAEPEAAARRDRPVQSGADHAAVARQADATDRCPLVHAGEAGLEHVATQAERALPLQVAGPFQARAVAQRPAPAGTQAHARLPACDGLRGRLQAEAAAAGFAEGIAADLRVLQVGVRRELHAARAEAVAALAVGHAIATVGVARHAAAEAAQLHRAAHRLAVMTHAEAAYRVPRVLHHA